MFLAQMSVESVKFTRLREDLHYSPERLQDKFPRYVKSIEQARELVAAGSDAIADCVYGPTHQGLNNTRPGDGHRFIGRGYIQLTGRENYRRAGLGVGIDLLNQPELAEQEEIAVRVAVWKWVTDVDRIAAQRGDVRAVTRGVNAGYHNLPERRYEYLRYQRLLRLRSFDRFAMGWLRGTRSSLPRRIFLTSNSKIRWHDGATAGGKARQPASGQTMAPRQARRPAGLYVGRRGQALPSAACP